MKGEIVYNMRIISVRDSPEYKDKVIKYFQSKWASKKSLMVYENCISHCITTKNPLPQWYLLMEGDEIIGCAGLITNDFISRMDLYPWMCALYIEEAHRGNSYGALLLEKAKEDARKGDLLTYIFAQVILNIMRNMVSTT